MSIRQYIGARYVTKIYENSLDPASAEWEASINYEPLTLVTYNYGSYISKKQVPASVGNPADNPTYWTQTGFYNGQIATLQNEIDVLNTEVTDIATIANNSYRNVILIGDSYGTKNGTGVETITHPLPELIQTYTKLPDSQFRASFENGAGFGNGLFYNNLASVANNMTAEEKEQVTDIYFLGGWNDESNRVTYAQFAQGVADCENLMNTDFPKALKHIVLISRCCFESTWVRLNDTIGWYEGLARQGWVVDKTMRYVLINPFWYESDFGHPNQTGVSELARAMTEVIYKGSVDITYIVQIFTSEFVAATGIELNLSSALDALYLFVNNGTTTIDMRSIANSFSVVFRDAGNNRISKTITFDGSELDLATLSHGIGGTYNLISLPVTVMFYDSSYNTRTPVECFLVFKNGHMYLKTPYLFSSENTVMTFNAYQLLFPSARASVDSMLV